MFLKFDVHKTVQAAGVLLRNEGKRMSMLRLLKLLIIADRESLRQIGRPILGSKMVAMDHGPLHSAIYDLIKGEHPDEAVWSNYIAKCGPREIALENEPEVGKLSRHEVELLNRVSEQYANMNDWEISEYTHTFPEWKTHFRPGTSTPIPLEDVIRGVGRDADAASILQDLKDENAFHEFFSQVAP